MGEKIKTSAVDVLVMLLGTSIYALSVNMLTAPNNIAPGGITGIATMLNYLFNTPIGTMILILNAPIIIWAIVEIGYKLVLKTSVAIVLSSVTIDVFALFLPAYHGDPILIALFAGVGEGVGLALVFMRGATTGGSDMIARLLNKRIRFMSIGKLMLVVDGVIIVSSAFVFSSIESAMYACIVVFVATKIIDSILYGTDLGTGKLFFIISKKSKEISERILNEMDRGVTFLKSRGGYSKTDGEILMCAVRRFEIFKIHQIIRQEDKDAFVIVGDAGEITGEGFKPSKVNDKTLKELMDKLQKKKEEAK